LLKSDSENEAGVEQLTQLLLDEGQILRCHCTARRHELQILFAGFCSIFSATLTPKPKICQKRKPRTAKAVGLDPSETSHQRGLGQTLISEEKYSDALAVYLKLSDLMPDDGDVYLSLAKIYRETASGG